MAGFGRFRRGSGPLRCPSTPFQWCPPAPRRETSRGKNAPRPPLAASLWCPLPAPGLRPLRAWAPPLRAPLSLRSLVGLSAFPASQSQEKAKAPPRERSLDITIPPVMVSALSLCYIRQKVNLSAGLTPAKSPARGERRADAREDAAPRRSPARVLPGLRQDNLSKAQNDPLPGAGQPADRTPPPRQGPDQTARRTAPAEAGTARITRHGGSTQKECGARCAGCFPLQSS